MMKTQAPLVSIVTLNWNATGITCDFLRSVKEHCHYCNIEVIVVDNGSKEDPTPFLKEIYPEVKIVLTHENLGYSGGNNRGLRIASGEYLFIVNNDTEFTPGLIEGLLEIFETYPDAGMASPKFHFFYHKGIIEYAGYQAVSPITGKNGMVGNKEEDKGQYDTVAETHYVHGGGMMISRKALEKVGFMPEDFFLYYEELDWSEQVKRQGFKIYYQPKSLIYHKESMSTGKESPLKTFYQTRNRILFMRRNRSLPAYLLFWAYFTVFTIPKNTLSFLYHRKKAHLYSFWKGICWNFNRSIKFQ